MSEVQILYEGTQMRHPDGATQYPLVQTAAAPAAQQERSTRLLSIGRIWDNSETATGNQPKLRIVLDRNLGLNITLAPGSQLVAFANQKREGKNDPDYRLAVELPRETVDAELQRQKDARAHASADAA